MQNLFEQKLVRMLTQAYSPLSESESSIISGRNSNDGLRPSLVWPGPLALKSLVFNMNWVSVFLTIINVFKLQEILGFSKSTIQKAQLQNRLIRLVQFDEWVFIRGSSRASCYNWCIRKSFSMPLDHCWYQAGFWPRTTNLLSLTDFPVSVC